MLTFRKCGLSKTRNREDGIRGAYELVFVTGDVRDIHVVGGGGDILLQIELAELVSIQIYSCPVHGRQTSFLPVKIYGEYEQGCLR